MQATNKKIPSRKQQMLHCYWVLQYFAKILATKPEKGPSLKKMLRLPAPSRPYNICPEENALKVPSIGTGSRPVQQAAFPCRPVSWENKPETQVGVAVARRVPVAVRGSHVPGGVVPAATAIDAVGASRRNPMGSYNPTPKGRGIRHPRKIN